MYDPCEYCIYANKNMDSIGKTYYTCVIENLPDNNIDNYPCAECNKKNDDED